MKKKIGILTFHYSTNYGGVLQSYALYKTIKAMGYDVEVINYVPKNYTDNLILKNLGINKKDIRSYKEGVQRLILKARYNKNIAKKFDRFRNERMKLSAYVNEDQLENLVQEYDTIIVGSDQVWNPSQRVLKQYFLGFDNFKGERISYAADSTNDLIDEQQKALLKNRLEKFKYISVRNKHSYEFVKKLISTEADIVTDPTILYDFREEINDTLNRKPYILAYILGEEIKGTHKKVIERIRRKYGNLPVYFINISTMKFNFYDCADKVLYDVGPEEWLSLFKHASFIYTDSYHGVLFSLKFKKSFLAYYTEELRASRFIDLGERYLLDKYIVKDIYEIDKKNSLEEHIPFNKISQLLQEHKKISEKFIKQVLGE